MLMLFVYGTLKNENVRRILGVDLEKNPIIDHTISGYEVKQNAVYGGYPALIPKPDGIVEGMIIKDVTPVQQSRLDRYEGAGYKLVEIEPGIHAYLPTKHG